MSQATVTALTFDGDCYHLSGWCFEKKQQMQVDGFALSDGAEFSPIFFERQERNDLVGKLGEAARMSGFRLTLSAEQAAQVFLAKSVKLTNLIGSGTYDVRFGIAGFKLDDPNLALAGLLSDYDALFNKAEVRDVLYALCNLILRNFNPNDKKASINLLVAAALLFNLDYEFMAPESSLHRFLLKNLSTYLLEKPSTVGYQVFALLLNSALSLRVEGAVDVLMRITSAVKSSKDVTDFWFFSVLFLQLNVSVFMGSEALDLKNQCNSYLKQLKAVAYNLPAFSDHEVEDYTSSCQLAYAVYLLSHVNSKELELSVLSNDFNGLERRIYSASKGCCAFGQIRSKF